MSLSNVTVKVLAFQVQVCRFESWKRALHVKEMLNLGPNQSHSSHDPNKVRPLLGNDPFD